MGYFKIMMDISHEDDVMSYCQETFGIEQYELKQGNTLQKWNERIAFYYDPLEGNRLTDFLANNLGWFIVSEKLKLILEELENKIEYFSVRIINKSTNELVEGYYVANIVNVVDALFLQESDYSEFKLDDEVIYNIRKHVLHSHAVNGVHIFKLPGHHTIPIFVSEKFKCNVKNNGITGIDFLEVKVI